MSWNPRYLADSNRWQVEFQWKKQKYYGGTHTTEADARAWKNRMVSDLERGEEDRLLKWVGRRCSVTNQQHEVAQNQQHLIAQLKAANLHFQQQLEQKIAQIREL
eukprot:SAG31_NODE_652_length_13181_cov_14.268155_13_plen_104_part_01